MTTMFGSAMPCNRAARFGVSPMMPAFLRLTRSDQVADDYKPGRNAEACLQQDVSFSAETAATNSSPARTARSASSSWACG